MDRKLFQEVPSVGEDGAERFGKPRKASKTGISSSRRHALAETLESLRQSLCLRPKRLQAGARGAKGQFSPVMETRLQLVQVPGSFDWRLQLASDKSTNETRLGGKRCWALRAQKADLNQIDTVGT